MRTRTLVSASLLAAFASLSLYACGDSDGDDGGDDESFTTFEDCFTDHHVTEGFTAPKAITICCLDHPIGSNAAGVVCGTTQASCETYVGANLPGSDASGSDTTAGCTDYITQQGM